MEIESDRVGTGALGMSKIDDIVPSKLQVEADPEPVTISGSGFSDLVNRNEVALLFLSGMPVEPEDAFVDNPPTEAYEDELVIPMQVNESILDKFPNDKSRWLKVRVKVFDDNGKVIDTITSAKNYITIEPKP